MFLLPERLFEPTHTGRKCRIEAHFCLYSLEAVNHRRVVATAEYGTDISQCHAQYLTTEVHGNLAWLDHLFRTALARKRLWCNTPLSRYPTGDDRGVSRWSARARRLERQRFPREIERNWAILERGIRQQAREGALHRAHVLRDLVGDERDHIIGNRRPVRAEFDFFAEDRVTMLDVRARHIGDFSPSETAYQLVVEARRLRCAIARHHDLATARMEHGERFGECILRGATARENVDVVDQQ